MYRQKIPWEPRAHFYTWPDGHVFVRSARRNGGLPDGAICRFCVATLRPRGCAPCAAYAAYPARPRKGDTRLRVCPPSEGLTTEHTDTLTAHRRRPGGRSFFYPFFSQRWATPFTWPAADRRRRTPSAGTGAWSGKGLPISRRGWYNGISFDGPRPRWDILSQSWGHNHPAQPLDTLSSQ